MPTSPAAARGWCVRLARELGREHRKARGGVLRADTGGIEVVQASLFERYGGRSVHSPDAWHDLWRHGALVCEVLARSLGAEWSDVASSDVSTWTMLLPDGTRLWPFARVLRYVAMGPKERDLVSYQLELMLRAAQG
jgi:hypothetical protein